MTASGPVFCFGELLIRLTATGHVCLSELPVLQPFVGGAEANVAAGLATLGHRVEMISVAPENALGDAALQELQRRRVGTDYVCRADGRMGLYFLTPGAVHRASDIVYDRKDSAFATFDFGALDWCALLKGAGCLHVSGVTAALGEAAYQAALAAMKTARDLGVMVSYDGNFRPKLWAEWSADPKTRIHDLLQEADLVFAGHKDISLVFGQSFTGDVDPQAREKQAADVAFALMPNLKIMASTTRTQFSADRNQLQGHAFSRDETCHSRVYDLERIVDRIGGGDAFAAGFLDGVLRKQPLTTCVQRAIAAACLKHAQPGDLCLVRSGDLDRFDDGSGFDVRR
ncbi:MAG: sugar kinase [Asticcacaulis sp.]